MAVQQWLAGNRQLSAISVSFPTSGLDKARHPYNRLMSPRFYIPTLLAPGASVDLPPEAAHHAARVLRLSEGDEIRLFDGRGGEWTAHIARLKPTVRVALDRFDPDNHTADLQITLVQALPAADKMDWVLQKAVELGVSAIQPVVGKRSIVRLSGDKIERRQAHWRNVVIAACEQCGANIVPVVAPLQDLPQYLAQTPAPNETRLLMLPGTEMRLRDLPRPDGPITILVGPEGGFEENEIELALLTGFKPLRFGPRVLRTETAGPAILAAMMALWGDA
jgi:16S rRNA (uracil1498-N3)-methyltransferase